ncbi:cation-translocating P-type ATPase [Nitrospina gracilis]|uniref:cation-translocating P-type ATPase n=1 Tax=Nitrospina gracilis TaxID=35801 RepID=UPI001F44E191|nr:cation-translocating P-type ATPase [Nitrospina gracilis]MCF8721798.1 Ca2+-transporting ATPase [Nitrospina gracilis Nb-211]
MGATENWHSHTLDRVYEGLASDASGLSAKEAAQRLHKFGLNELAAADHVSAWTVFANQFKNILIVILLVAITLSAFLGEVVESVAIGVIVLFAILLGFIQEFRAERAIEALKKMAAPVAHVLRDGIEKEIPAREVVPGDLLLLSMGDKVPADARIVETVNLKTDEAALTGESLPVEKVSTPLNDDALPIGDRINMVFSGTTVTYGRGRVLAVATGMNTEFGKITRMLKTVEDTETPLQKNLDRVGRVLAWAALAVVVIIVLLGVLRGSPLLDMFLFGIALAVAVVPEALPAVVTISLALGVQRMSKRNALIRHLPTVETLGSTSVICSDKTGTLTRDEMMVRKIRVAGEWYEVTGSGYDPTGGLFVDGREAKLEGPLLEFLRGGALASDARLLREDGTSHIKGDATEGALVVLAEKAGFRHVELESHWPRIQEIPFTSERKRMTTLHRDPEGGTIAYSKGAPEILISACAYLATPTGDRPMQEADREQLRAAAQDMAGEALRVLAIACKRDASLDHVEEDMTFLGLAGMIDPPRTEAAEAIRTCISAGIRPVMITGDHPQTAQAVARELGLLANGKIVTGAEVESMTESELEQRVEQIDVYARVSPEHKLRVVDALQKRGHIVAMTGDGVNDAPALKQADVGVAMGITGTDVSREAADMTLTDDNFASIVGAVEEGRGIFGNIKKFLMYLLSSNIGEIGLISAAVLTGLPLPLSAVQILYVNLATDGLPALALSVDPPEDDLMRRPPRDPNTGVFTPPVLTLMLLSGVWIAAANFGLFAWALHTERTVEQAMAMTFLSLVIIQLFNAYNFRSDRFSAFRHPLSNKWLNLAVLWELVLLSLIFHVPVLEQVFGTYTMSMQEWAVVIGVAFTVVPVIEIGKFFVRRKWKRAH